MKLRLKFRTICLVSVLLTSACAPAAAPARVPAEAVVIEQTATTISTPTGPATRTPLPVATSRGPNLEATDPMGVALASGSVQLVEFFRFT